VVLWGGTQPEVTTLRHHAFRYLVTYSYHVKDQTGHQGVNGSLKSDFKKPERKNP